MPSSYFIQDVTAFVKGYMPEAIWEIKKDYTILYLNERNKSVCFIGNQGLDNMHLLNHRFYITEFAWQKNKEASKSRLSSLMGLTHRIHARQCTLSRIDKITAKNFINENHTMGYAASYYHYGLFLKNELAAVACFSKGRRMNRLPPGKKSFELIRFCNKNFHTVIGGLSKLIHLFEKEYSPGDIMTYVDIAWGQPNAYYALGFVLDKVTPSIALHDIMPDGEVIEYRNKGNYKLIKHLV